MSRPKPTPFLRVKLELYVRFSEDLQTLPFGGPGDLDPIQEALINVFHRMDERVEEIMPGTRGQFTLFNVPRKLARSVK